MPNSTIHFPNTTITENNEENSANFDIPTTGQTIVKKFNPLDTLSFNGTLFSGSGYSVVDANNEDYRNTWLLETKENGFYALYRINDNNEKSIDGTRLMIAPIEQTTIIEEGFNVNNQTITRTNDDVIIENFLLIKH